MASLFQQSYRYKDRAMMALRVGIGIMLFFHGAHKLAGGVAEWEKVGMEAMEIVGMDLFPAVLGFLAAFLQVAGGICIALGLFFPFTSAAVFSTMLVATAVLLYQNEPFSHYSHPIEMSMLLIGFILIGPGKYSLDYRLSKDPQKKEALELGFHSSRQEIKWASSS